MSRILINDLEEFDTLANRGEKDFRNYVEDQYQNSKCDVRLYFEPIGNKKFPDYIELDTGKQIFLETSSRQRRFDRLSSTKNTRFWT